jgi:hypothetical protein
MKLNLQVKLHPEFGPDIDVQPDQKFLSLTVEEQQAILLEAIRALEHQIIMISHHQEDSSIA